VFSAREMELQIQGEDQASALHALQILPRRRGEAPRASESCSWDPCLGPLAPAASQHSFPRKALNISDVRSGGILSSGDE
jgi:hypothetical protein